MKKSILKKIIKECLLEYYSNNTPNISMGSQNNYTLPYVAGYTYYTPANNINVVNNDYLTDDMLTEPGINPDELRMGIQQEYRSTKDVQLARKIAIDNIKNDPVYYSSLSVYFDDTEETKAPTLDPISYSNKYFDSRSLNSMPIKSLNEIVVNYDEKGEISLGISEIVHLLFSLNDFERDEMIHGTEQDIKNILLSKLKNVSIKYKNKPKNRLEPTAQDVVNQYSKLIRTPEFQPLLKKETLDLYKNDPAMHGRKWMITPNSGTTKPLHLTKQKNESK
jgi:hypothetical protein